jgi:glycosyltransferase involved in cell wall biosynthesis
LATQPTFTVIMPAYNEAECIGEVIASLRNLDGCQEIIVVDDGSIDSTSTEAEAAGARVIKHPYNRGYGAALKSGINACTTDWLILCDSDGQHLAHDVARLSHELASCDMLVGARSGASHKNWWRMPGKAVLLTFARMWVNHPIPDLNSGLRGFRTQSIRDCLHLMPNGFSFTTTSTLAMFSMGYAVRYLPIEVQPRQGRPSTVRPVQDGMRILILILNLVVLFNPMKFFLPFSMVFLGAAAIYFAYYSSTVRVHVTESMVLLFVTGILLFSLGLVSEQISALRRDLRRGR